MNRRVSEPYINFNVLDGTIQASDVAGAEGEKPDHYYMLWRRQQSELVALRFLVSMQLVGIFVLAIAIGCLLFRGY